MRRVVTLSVLRSGRARNLSSLLSPSLTLHPVFSYSPHIPLTRENSSVRGFTESTSDPSKVDDEKEGAEEVDDQSLIEMFSSRSNEWWNHDDNVMTFLDFLIRKLDINSLEKWYDVTAKQVRNNGGARLIDVRGALSTVIPLMYPDHEWLPWKFERVPYDFWNNTANQKRYMTWLAQTLNKEEGKPEDWYGITKTDFAHNYGAHLLTKYQYSPYKLFSSLYPDAEWIKWGFARSTAGFWDDEAMQREYLDWLGQKLGYSDKEGWYGVTTTDFVENHGGGLLKVHYSNDPSALVMKIYSDHTWIPWKFDSTPNNLWDQLKNRQAYVEWLKNIVGISDETELKPHHFIDNYGASLLSRCDNSPAAVLESLKEVEKPPTEEATNRTEESSKKATGVDSPETNKNYWRSRENQKLFVEEFGRAMGIEPGEYQKWYKVTYEDFHNHGGSWIKRYYDNSLYLLMKTLYPEHKWIAYKFETPKKPKPGEPVKEKIDWSRVSQAQLQAMGIARVIRMHNGLENALAKMNKTPAKPKSFGTVSWNKKANQRLIVVFLREFFPGMEVVEDILHPDIRYEETGRRMQLDVYVPELRLAIEYQGAQHYHQTNVFGDVGERVVLDAEKEVACIAADISLITVPYWWDMRRESLLKTILDKRPDLRSKISPGKMDPSLIPPEEPIPDILA